MTTGVFFDASFMGRNWPIIGDCYEGFAEMLRRVSGELENVVILKPEPVSMELLLTVHSKHYIEQVKKAWYYNAARLTVGGCVQASEMIWRGDLDNAVVFLVAAGHHTHSSYAWGGTYLSCIGPVLHRLRCLGLKKIAYVDTDSHHGDGARDILMEDQDALHVCFCGQDRAEGGGTKLCVNVGWHITNERYLQKVRETTPKLREFKPEMVVHFFGHDTHKEDYGNRGVDEEFFVELAKAMKQCTDEICGGRYLVIDGGGANARVGRHIWPKIIDLLTDIHKTSHDRVISDNLP